MFPRAIAIGFALSLHLTVSAQDDLAEAPTRLHGISYQGAPGLTHDDDGQLVGGCRGYRARFTSDGPRFLPALGRTAPRLFPVDFRLEDVARGATHLALAAAAPEADELQVRYDRRTCVERYDLRADGMALSLVFPVPVPGDGDLRVAFDLDTELQPTPTDEPGVALRWPGLGGIDIGGVEGIDARGRRVRGSIGLSGHTLELGLPAEFLDAAEWPVVLDPLIGTRLQLEGTTADIGVEPDIAWEPLSQRFCVVWEEWFSNNVADVRARIVRPDGVPIGSELFVTLNSGSRSIAPAAASVRFRGRFGIVWQDDRAGNWDVWGISLDPTDQTFGAPTALADGPADEVMPDVGGDPSDTDDDLVVVWREISPNAIRARQVSIYPDESLRRFATSEAVRTGSGLNNPRISRSAGQDGRFLIVWTAEQTGHTDVEGSVYSRNLQRIGSAFRIANSAADEDLPDVDGNGSEWIVAYETETTPGSRDNDIVARPVFLDGTLPVRGSEFVVEGDTNDDERFASVAWMGGSALIAYLDQRAPGSVWDVYVRSIDPFTCQSCEGVSGVHDTGGDDNAGVVVCGTHGLSGDTAGDFALIAYENDSGTNLQDVMGALYRTDDGLVTDLARGCPNGGRAAATCARVPHGGFQIRVRDVPGLVTVYLVLSTDRLLGSGACGGCELVADPFRGWVLPVLSDFFGNAGAPLALPNEPSLRGATFYAQWISSGGRGCPTWNVEFSNALLVEIQ